MNSISNLHYLSDLLPGSTQLKISKELKKNLQEYLLLLYCTEQTILELESRNFSAFDPLVGENFCQSRALKVAMEALPCNSSLALKKDHILAVIAKIEKLISSGNKWFKENATISFNEILANKEFQVELNENELFFITSYLLSIIKGDAHVIPALTMKEEKDLKKLQYIVPVSSGFCKKLVDYLQKMLANFSVEFVRNLALQSKNVKHIKYVSEAHTIPHNHLPCIPFYWGTDVIKEAMKSIPLVLWSRQLAKDGRLLREICLYYEPTKDGYRERLPSFKDLGKPAIVLQGSACRDSIKFPTKQFWRYDLLKYDISNFLKLCAADHRQFPGSHYDSVIESDQKLIKYKNKAVEVGCSLKNPNLFLISHVFCSKIEDLSPLKYVLNNHLVKYHDFYRAQFIKEIQAYFKPEYQNCYELLGSKLRFKIEHINDFEQLKKKVFYGYFFMLDPKILNNNENDKEFSEIDLKISDITQYYVNPIKLAKEYANPLEFLLDHKSYWSFRGKEIIDFLVSNPQSYENPELMTHLLETLNENQYNFVAQEKAIFGLGQALSLPQSKNSAKNFLMEFATNVDAKYLNFRDLKKSAMQQLRPLLNELDVRLFFQKISLEDPCPSVKMEARSYLDESIDQKEQFNISLFKEMLYGSTLGFSADSKVNTIRNFESPLLFDYLVWNNQPYSYQAILDFGEVEFTNHVINLFKTNGNWSSY